jgi:hypothetical protein
MRIFILSTLRQILNGGELRWESHVAHMGEVRYLYTVLVGKSEEKGPLKRPKHGSEYIVILKWIFKV